LFIDEIVPKDNKSIRAVQPPVQWVSGALFLRVKRSGRDVNNPFPFSAMVKNEWSYTSTPSIRIHGVDRDVYLNLYPQTINMVEADDKSTKQQRR
jgi:hypothetical protein